ncbi:hypothetical protein BDY24DRAFT_129568 [Mrakia frigida]|uniref:uncharacterized protein n=1 Tax=Mrakia frigida TaxID=29902 RepID=UPI003FCBFCA7
MLSIRRTSLKASTSSLAATAGSRQASSTSSSSKGRYLYPDGTPRRYVPVYPTGIHPALVNVQGLRSPSSRQARIPGAPRPRPTHPYPYNLNPNALNRPQLIETIRQALPRPTNPRPYDLFPTAESGETERGAEGVAVYGFDLWEEGAGGEGQGTSQEYGAVERGFGV